MTVHEFVTLVRQMRASQRANAPAIRQFRSAEEADRCLALERRVDAAAARLLEAADEARAVERMVGEGGRDAQAH